MGNEASNFQCSVQTKTRELGQKYYKRLRVNLTRFTNPKKAKGESVGCVHVSTISMSMLVGQ